MKIQRSARAHFAIAFWIGASALLGCGSSAERARAEATGENVGCTSDAVADAGGQRRLALVVGVGQYKAEKVPDLAGPPNDARRIYELLTGESGFAFPRQNVCLLLNEQATTAAFRKAFDEALVARARPQDLAVIFYAGHGSQAKDRSGDEPDGWDETLMLHDARVEGQRDLVDDEFHGMLQRLHAQTSNIVVILDSCNSGTATRDGSGEIGRAHV